ncbi:lantibiotic immunity ABC transporter MutE/EpiE family permease subunit [Paenibacillus sp. NFR01]|uniref:lantibiotic immunity ABC transporter MutE/EpiE family permease subunit n=1 Tax=Paenibacillus sp. NFR01 TaxID=1566279 RepID=UPI0008C0C01F|nr:lantibiotic immunity ABC transporter MutE/EpiE family permease subunit [Paenibacillus sp. NFR01]SEU09591.1 ABC-2 type transport system permease protein [Paenibacillus sp. NFR01]
MLRLISAERLKWRRTFVPWLVWIAPLFTLMLCFLLMGGPYFQTGAYNWWYTMLLPGALTLACSLAMQKDARMKYRALLALPLRPQTLWSAKIAAATGWLLFTILLFFIGISSGGWLFGSKIPLLDSAAGSLLIFLTFLWQIPLCLFLAARFGLFAAVLLNMALNIAGVATFDIGGAWDFMPYTITFRLLCPVLHILPNGLPVPENSPLRSTDTILLDVLVSLIWFAVLFFLTGRSFRKQEAR